MIPTFQSALYEGLKSVRRTNYAYSGYYFSETSVVISIMYSVGYLKFSKHISDVFQLAHEIKDDNWFILLQRVFVFCLIEQYPTDVVGRPLETRLAVSKVAKPTPYQIAYYLAHPDDDGVIFSSNFSTGFDGIVVQEPTSSFITEYANLVSKYLKNDQAVYDSISSGGILADKHLDEFCSECSKPHRTPFSKLLRYRFLFLIVC